MNGFGKMYEDKFNPTVIKAFGISRGIGVFETNSESISKSSFNYALQRSFELLIKPTRSRDPTGVFSRIFRGTALSSFKFEAEGDWRSLWESSLGIISLDYPTMTTYFGRDLSLIQPALRYTVRNLDPRQALGGIQPLSVSELLTSQFKEKIDHLYNNLYNSLSTSYKDGDQLTVTFHRDTSQGINDNSLLKKTLLQEIRNKFSDLIGGNINENSFSIVLDKQSGKLMNEKEFNSYIASIVLYLVLFNAKALIQENDGSYGLIASQRELLGADYIYQLGVNELSDTGKEILSTYQSSWNINTENRIVWNYGDCWPIHLFNDARALIAWFNVYFLKNKGTITTLITTV